MKILSLGNVLPFGVSDVHTLGNPNLSLVLGHFAIHASLVSPEVLLSPSECLSLLGVPHVPYPVFFVVALMPVPKSTLLLPPAVTSRHLLCVS